MYVSYAKKPVDPDFTKVRRLLFYSINGIGDAVLESAVFSRLPELFPNAHITVFCQAVAAAFFERCPFVRRVISIDSKKAGEQGYLDSIFAQLAAVEADLALNLVSRPSTGLIMFLWAANAPIMSIALQKQQGNADAERCRADFARSIGALIPTTSRHGHVLAEQMDVLRALGFPPAPTRVWLAGQDRAQAENIFTRSGLRAERTIALAGVSSSPLKDYHHFAEALAPLCRKLDLSVLALGGKAEEPANARILAALGADGVKGFNASGQTPLPVAAALVEKSLFTLGVDTGLMHIACALGRPNAVLLGCGNIGWVWPYSAFNSIICLPLSCIGCGWHCPYPQCHCIQGLNPQFVGEAVEQALTLHYPHLAGSAATHQPPAAPLVFMQRRDLFTPPEAGIKWQSPTGIIDPDSPPRHLRFGIMRRARGVEAIEGVFQ